MLQAALEEGTPFLLTSSSEVYGWCSGEPMQEDGFLRLPASSGRRWSYAVSKLMAEHFTLAVSDRYGLPVWIVRLFNVVGARQHPQKGVLPRFVLAALRGKPLRLYGTGRQRRTFTHVRDVVRVLLKLPQLPQAQALPINVAGRQRMSLHELALRVLTVLGRRVPIRCCPYPEGDAEEDPPDRLPDLNRLQRLLGWVPSTPVDVAVQEVRDEMLEKIHLPLRVDEA